MVSLNRQAGREPDRSWRDLLSGARGRLRELASGSVLDCALARFFLKVEDFPSLDVDTMLSTFSPTATKTASLGFVIATRATTAGDAEKKFLEGLDQCARQMPPLSGPSVHTDPKLLTGLAAGAAAVNCTGKRREWLETQLAQLTKQPVLTKAIVGAYGLTLLGMPDGYLALEEELRKVQLNSPAEAPAVLWALRLDPTRFSGTNRNELTKAQSNALKLFPLVELEYLDVFGCAFVALTASDLLQASVCDLEKTAIGRLTEILERFPVAMAREAKAPENEFDVQRILWTMLAGVYQDLRDEEWLARFGVYHPRADLAIESMKTIVEAKFIKAGSGFRKVQEELVSDATTYTARQERFDKIIAVVYDATSSQFKYDQMRSALEGVRGIARVIIFPRSVPRPSKRSPVRTARPRRSVGARRQNGPTSETPNARRPRLRA